MFCSFLSVLFRGNQSESNLLKIFHDVKGNNSQWFQNDVFKNDLFITFDAKLSILMLK